MIKILKWLLAIALAIQLIPFGHTHTNPPSTKEPAWNSPGTRALFRRACFDCHSNETTWPWYSHVAPVSWLVFDDVNSGRGKLNFTEWDKPQPRAQDIANEVKSHDMPLWFYVPMHPNAKLSDADRQALIDGAGKSVGPQK